MQSVGSCCVAWFVSASGPVNPAAVRSTKYPRCPCVPFPLQTSRCRRSRAAGVLRDGRFLRLEGKGGERGMQEREKRRRQAPAGMCSGRQGLEMSGGRNVTARAWGSCSSSGGRPTPVRGDHSARLLRVHSLRIHGPCTVRHGMAVSPRLAQQKPGGWAAGPVSGSRLAHTVPGPAGRVTRRWGSTVPRCDPGRLPAFLSGPDAVSPPHEGSAGPVPVGQMGAGPTFPIQGSGSAAGVLPAWAPQAMPNRATGRCT